MLQRSRLSTGHCEQVGARIRERRERFVFCSVGGGMRISQVLAASPPSGPWKMTRAE